MHRFVWDLHWEAPRALESAHPIAAIPHDTPKEPRGPWAVPGLYTVRLTAAGRTLTRQLRLRMDPRVKTPAAALAQQLALSRRLAQALDQDTELTTEVRKMRAAGAGPELEALEGIAEERRPWAKEQPPSLVPWNARLLAMYDTLQSNDLPPTPQAVRAVEKVLKEAKDLFGRARAELAKYK